MIEHIMDYTIIASLHFLTLIARKVTNLGKNTNCLLAV